MQETIAQVINTILSGDVELLSAESAQTLGSTQSVGIQDGQRDDSLIVFFAIGFVINIAVITAYFIWAIKQWKKNKADDGEL